MELRAGERPDRLGGLLLTDAERAVPRERRGEHAQVAQPCLLESAVELGERRLARRRAGEDAEERPDALEPRGDVLGEQAQLLALLGRRHDARRTRLIEDLRLLVAARGSPHQRLEQGHLGAEGRVHRLGGRAGVRGDGRDGGPGVPALDEAPPGRLEDALPRPPRRLPAAFGLVPAAGLDGVGHFATVALSSTQ